ncbi:hypothetical protein EYF80_051479 [Liparis tanakae]|uniref:Uncharacterized protein n=1 Tax=Liparis tanakae TaxID=230148 RepID=A0A4Z2FBS4_9TELE|nr:hypothetical protein EYF80_051479 [Liparis tanakae]
MSNLSPYILLNLHVQKLQRIIRNAKQGEERGGGGRGGERRGEEKGGNSPPEQTPRFKDGSVSGGEGTDAAAARDLASSALRGSFFRCAALFKRPCGGDGTQQLACGAAQTGVADSDEADETSVNTDEAPTLFVKIGYPPVTRPGGPRLLRKHRRLSDT